jgi:hypothetical protein
MGLGPLEFFDIEANILEELAQIGHCRAPFCRQPLPLFPEDSHATFEGRAESKVMKIDDTRREAAADAICGPVNHRGLACPYRSVAQNELE